MNKEKRIQFKKCFLAIVPDKKYEQRKLKHTIKRSIQTDCEIHFEICLNLIVSTSIHNMEKLVTFEKYSNSQLTITTQNVNIEERDKKLN